MAWLISICQTSLLCASFNIMRFIPSASSNWILQCNHSPITAKTSITSKQPLPVVCRVLHILLRLQLPSPCKMLALLIVCSSLQPAKLLITLYVTKRTSCVRTHTYRTVSSYVAQSPHLRVRRNTACRHLGHSARWEYCPTSRLAQSCAPISFPQPGAGDDRQHRARSALSFTGPATHWR